MTKTKAKSKKKASSKKKAPSKKMVARKVAKKAVKKAVRKPAARAARAPKRKPTAKPEVAALPAEKQIVGGILLGHAEDYFAHVSVMALKLLAPVSVGDMIRIKGHTTDITQSTPFTWVYSGLSNRNGTPPPAGFAAVLLLLPVISLVSYSTMALLPVLAIVRVMKVAENATALAPAFQGLGEDGYFIQPLRR
jgi:hypothetical protein